MREGPTDRPYLERLIPLPGVLEEDHVDLAADPGTAWERVRHGDLGRSALVRALFAIRTLADRRGSAEDREGPSIRLDDLVSTPERPGFGILVDDAPYEVCVGAIGKVWKPDIPFLHVPDARAFERFDEPGWIKVAWALRIAPRGERGSRCTLELRVASTDADAWRRFRRYYRLIGPASRFIRHSALRALQRELGSARSEGEDERTLSGDELIPDAAAQLTHAITIEAAPETVWPWLVQMGCGRAGFYSIDWLDNAGVRSAREVHPELQDLSVGDIVPASPGSEEGFEVLRLEPPRALVLGGLFDPAAEKQLPFRDPRPERYWHVTWAFVLEPLDGGGTRLWVRARAAFPGRGWLHAAWVRPVHALMERAQLRNLKARAEGRGSSLLDLRDVAGGIGGAALMAAALLTPFLRQRRTRWGLDRESAERALPGDELVPEPRWSWTHGIEIDAPADAVWPWVAQIGADRGGFYSYEWLENLVGTNLRNAETIHPEWQAREGDALLLHPEVPPLPLVRVEPGHYMLAHAAADPDRDEGRPWVAVSWLFLVEPLGPDRSRFLSRYRANCSDDLATRLSFGATFVEPIGFVMDRRMLMGVKERAEGMHGSDTARPSRG